MGPTIKFGYMGHLRQCLIFGMRNVILIAIPGPLYIIITQRWTIHQSFSQSPVPLQLTQAKIIQSL